VGHRVRLGRRRGCGPAAFLLLVVSGFVFFDGLYIGPQTRNVADAIERDKQAGSASDAAFPEGRDV
jgi:lipopolysaccharide export LptBFGC system permease protein LptF